MRLKIRLYGITCASIDDGESEFSHFCKSRFSKTAWIGIPNQPYMCTSTSDSTGRDSTLDLDPKGKRLICTKIKVDVRFL